MIKLLKHHKTFIVIALLVIGLKFPLLEIAGVVLMWRWMKWLRWVKFIISIPIIITILASVLILLTLFSFRPFQVTGVAMEPNFKNNEYIFTKVFGAKTFERGDVIVLKSPLSPERDLIKRIVGLPGETAMLKNGDVYINGQKLDESKYLQPSTKTYAESFLKESEEKTIPVDSYFVLGDNRDHSSDSREFGFVKKTDIISKSLFCYWNCK